MFIEVECLEISLRNILLDHVLDVAVKLDKEGVIAVPTLGALHTHAHTYAHTQAIHDFSHITFSRKLSFAKVEFSRRMGRHFRKGRGGCDWAPWFFSECLLCAKLVLGIHRDGALPPSSPLVLLCPSLCTLTGLLFMQIRKLILTCFLGVLYKASVKHLAGSLMTIFLFLLAQMLLKPYLNQGLNVFQRLSLISVINLYSSFKMTLACFQVSKCIYTRLRIQTIDFLSFLASYS